MTVMNMNGSRIFSRLNSFSTILTIIVTLTVQSDASTTVASTTTTTADTMIDVSDRTATCTRLCKAACVSNSGPDERCVDGCVKGLCSIIVDELYNCKNGRETCVNLCNVGCADWSPMATNLSSKCLNNCKHNCDAYCSAYKSVNPKPAIDSETMRLMIWRIVSIADRRRRTLATAVYI